MRGFLDTFGRFSLLMLLDVYSFNAGSGINHVQDGVSMAENLVFLP